jgi:hypothetical protein
MVGAPQAPRASRQDRRGTTGMTITPNTLGHGARIGGAGLAQGLPADDVRPVLRGRRLKP